MTEGWNIFKHSAGESPEKTPSWVRTKMLDSVDFHVWPTSDEIEHGLTEHCACGPEIETEERDGVLIARAITHKAWDGRPGPLE